MNERKLGWMDYINEVGVRSYMTRDSLGWGFGGVWRGQGREGKVVGKGKGKGRGMRWEGGRRFGLG